MSELPNECKGGCPRVICHCYPNSNSKEDYAARISELEKQLADERKAHEETNAARCQLIEHKAQLRAQLALRDEAQTAAVLAERLRIAAALREEAGLLPCAEDASVTRSNADLIEANFSYEEAESISDGGARATIDKREADKGAA